MHLDRLKSALELADSSFCLFFNNLFIIKQTISSLLFDNISYNFICPYKYKEVFDGLMFDGNISLENKLLSSKIKYFECIGVAAFKLLLIFL